MTACHPIKSICQNLLELMYNILYNKIAMFDLSQIFSSKARTKILMTLFQQDQPIPLRHVAYLCEIPVYSVQCALKQLTREKIVFRKRDGRHLLFGLNKQNPNYSFLAGIFLFAVNFKVRARAENYSKRASSTLKFISSSREFFKKVKGY